MQIGWCVELDILLPPSLSPSLWVNPLLLSLGPAKPQTIDAVYSELSLKSPLWELVCVRLLRELHRPRGSVCVKMTSSWSALRVRGFVWCVPFLSKLETHSWSGGRPRGSGAAFIRYDEEAV